MFGVVQNAGLPVMGLPPLRSCFETAIPGLRARHNEGNPSMGTFTERLMDSYKTDVYWPATKVLRCYERQRN